MFITLFSIIKVLLGAGLAGILMIIGMVFLVLWIIKAIVTGISEAWYKGKKKGGDE